MQNEPFADEKAVKEYYIQRVLEAPVIDGNLDDPAWVQIIPITDFIQEDPDNMAEPTEKTKVYLTYDDQFIYVAAQLYDSNPSEIVKQLAARDDWYGAFDEMSDWISIDLDSRHDHQTGFSFAVNASGVISDEMVYHDTDFDSDWNAIWQAEVQIDELGWRVEMKIPFSNLPFFEGETQFWGMNITRFIQRKYETITWVAFPLELDGIVSKYGHIYGFQGIYPPSKFEFSPYLMARSTSYSDIQLKDYNKPLSHITNYKNEPDQSLGLDFTYRINTNSKIKFTINPDFGQVESDPEDINLTSLETYFHDKRPFFLEDADIFETPIDIFYSRRIGNTINTIKFQSGQDTIPYSDVANCDSTWFKKYYTSWIIEGDKYFANYENYPFYYNLPVIIKGASKLTGKTESGLSYGLLGAVTTLDDSSGWTRQMMEGSNRNYFVSRIKQDLFSGNSFIGFMTTSSLADSAHTFSIDGMTNFYNNQIGIDGQIIITSDQHAGMYSSISLSPLGHFSGWFDYYYYDRGLDINDVGYLWRDNYSQTKVGIKFQTLESWNVVRNASVILEGDIEENANGLDLGKTIELSYDIQFINYWGLEGGGYNVSEAYDDREISLWMDNTFGPAVLIPELGGTYLKISSDKHKNIYGSINWTWANNTRKDMERNTFIEMTYRPNPFLNFSISYDYYKRKKKYDYTYDLETEWDTTLCADIDTHYVFSSIDEVNDILTLRTNWNINRKLSIQGYIEYFSLFNTYNKDSYVEYNEINDEFIASDYILGKGQYAQYPPFYTDNPDSIYNFNGELMSYLDPNHFIGFYPKYTSLIFNGIVKWNYIKGSNIYFVYTFNKNVNGTSLRGINGFKDFLQFNDKKHWVEVLRDHSFMIKIDYWFEK